MLQLYHNIKSKREELGISQDELAGKTGYTSRSSIAKIEKGLVDLTQTKIDLFAKALETTPSNLMGWDEQVEETADALFNLINDEVLQRLNELYGGMNEQSRKRLMNYADLLIREEKENSN